MYLGQAYISRFPTTSNDGTFEMIDACPAPINQNFNYPVFGDYRLLNTKRIPIIE
jgi:hypothetical protein